MEFTITEMDRRLHTVRTRMQAADVDCLMVTGVENFCYFAGVPVALYQERRPWCALIPLEREPVAFTMEGTHVTLERQGYFRDVQAYSLPVSPNLTTRIEGSLKRLRVKRLACELGLDQRLGMPVKDFEAIRAALPEVQFVDGAGIIWSMRMFKSPEEVERMKRACEITGATRQVLFKEIRQGMTETDVAAIWARLMFEAGAERPAFIFVNSGGPPDFLPKHERILRRGDTLWVDGGVYVHGYTCDFSRVATLGEASPRQRQLHRDAVEVMACVLEAIGPGVKVARLSEICAREMTRRGYSGFGNNATVVAGHGMGMITNEPPLIASWDETVLSDGLVTGIELGPIADEGMFIWEDLVQVKPTGYELLTTETSDLIEIDF